MHQFSPDTIQPSSHSLSRIYDTTGRTLLIDKLLTGPDAHIWNQGVSDEMGRLTKGNDTDIEWTDTMEFIQKNEVSQHIKVTYCSFVYDVQLFKKETHRVRLVVGGDRLEYDFDTGSPAFSMLDTQNLCNSTISNASKGARFLDVDIKYSS